jgi:Ca-activated chloride channel family protein
MRKSARLTSLLLLLSSACALKQGVDHVASTTPPTERTAEVAQEKAAAQQPLEPAKPVDAAPPPPPAPAAAKPSPVASIPSGDVATRGPMPTSESAGEAMGIDDGLMIERAKMKAEAKSDAKPVARRAQVLPPREEQSSSFTQPTGPERAEKINDLVDPAVDRLSTFAIDVDTGSYTLAKRMLAAGSLPNAGTVRVEEWVNAFHYSYPDESGRHPFSIHMEGAPLAKQTQVLRIGIQGKRIAKSTRDPVHLTFLVDVSGSMQGNDRLPLVKRALEMLVGELGPKDSVSLVTYANGTGVTLSSTDVTAENKPRILEAIEGLRASGGTAMGSGMELAYREAGKALGEKGISRVIVLSDGDANIGKTSFPEILKAIKGYVSEGVTMSTVGFGTGNYRDNLMEQLADAGNGNYSYVGNIKDAKRIFVDDLTGTLQVIAKDTKIQVEMNPDVVASYRLIGYENRDIADVDFRNDKVDAGEIGAGHTVTALYEVTLKNDDPVGDIATVRVRYKTPRGDEVSEVSKAFPASSLRHDVSEMSADGRFATGVMLTAEVMRQSPHMDRLGLGLADALRLMNGALSGPYQAERDELASLVRPFVDANPVALR